MLSSYIPQSNRYHLVVYNAYSGDFYYALQGLDFYTEGCVKKEVLLEIIQAQLKFEDKVICIGQAVSLLYSFLTDSLHNPIIFEGSIFEPSVQQLGLIAYQKYKKGSTLTHVEPLYFKNAYNL